MVPFYDWCDSADMPLGNHHVRVMTGRPGDIATGIQMTARAIPAHYTTEERIAAALAKLGKTAAAQMLNDLLRKLRILGRVTLARSMQQNGLMRTAVIARLSKDCAGRIIEIWQCAAMMSSVCFVTS